MYLVDSASMKAIDSVATEKFGVPASILMENAGANTVTAMTNEYGALAYRNIAVFCGAGNNGGDGFVIARHLLSEGAVVAVFLTGDESKMSPESKQNMELVKKYGIAVVKLESLEDINRHNRMITLSDILVDALIGTGLSRDVDGFMAQLIVYINTLNKRTVSVDIPSGVDADTGNINGVAVYADLTVTFGLPKTGMAVFPGHANTGKLVVADINFPPELLLQPRPDVLVTAELIGPLMPYRQPNANKGSFGPIFILGGSPGLSGAVVLAAKAALRSGAGIVNVGIPESLHGVVKPGCDEMIVTSLKETSKGMLAYSNKENILKLCAAAKVVIIGPGIGRDPETQKLVRELVSELKKPLVIDADGINAVAADKNCLKNNTKDVIMTPHIGEMARLCGIEISEVIKGKIKVLKDFTASFGINVLLKDGRSMLADPQGNMYVNTTGNSGMATPGSGDVLTGLIAALMAHGMQSVQAGILGSYIHGLAGDLLLSETSEEGITAGDIALNIPKAIMKLK
ncbi:MAG: NAD(P)H-hydrate dehydratase [Candidatus Goldbacteria bacterium]|nr:NAD(P)H-hydrate dehydratase [Candidatus Goldiibacteriota bacterium]